MKKTFSVSVWKEYEHHVAQCRAVAVGSQGYSRKEALTKLREALKLKFEEIAVPKNASFDQIMERLYFSWKLTQGLEQLDAGQGGSHEEAKGKLSRWLNH